MRKITTMGIFTLCLFLTTNCFAQINLDPLSNRLTSEQTLIEKFDRGLYNKVFQSYKSARVLPQSIDRNNGLALAVEEVSRLTNKSPNFVEGWLLGSQVYRSRGGIPYAKKYYNKALEQADLAIVMEPQNIDNVLRYAIICYAGDVNYWPEYSKYEKIAKAKAEAVLDFFDKQKKKHNKKNNKVQNDYKRAEKVANKQIATNVFGLLEAWNSINSVNDLEEYNEAQIDKKQMVDIPQTHIAQKMLANMILGDKKEVARLVKVKATEESDKSFMLAYKEYIDQTAWYSHIGSAAADEKEFMLNYIFENVASK